MAYLKCTRCEHLNEVTEFQTFCNNCGKRLENNFQTWKKLNPYKSFEDYKSELAVVTRSVSEIKTRKRIQPKIIAAMVITALINLALVSGFVYLKLHPFESGLLVTATAMNNVCPMMINGETRLDKVAYVGNNEIEYHFSLVHYEKSADLPSLDNFKTTIHDLIINGLKNNPMFEAARKYKPRFTFVYNDMNGELLYKMTVTDHDYGDKND